MGRYVVIVNPRGGTRRGLAVLESVRPNFAKHQSVLEVHRTDYSGHATELAAALPLDKAAGIIVIGGDGTLHEVINGLMRRSGPIPPLGLIPGGTGNSVAQHLGIGNAETAALRILAQQPSSIDLARVALANRTVYCVNIVGWGGVVNINRTAERLRWLGQYRYATAAVWHILRPRRRQARLRFNGDEELSKFVFIIGCCTQFTGSGMRLAPKAHLADGLIDVVIVRRASRRQTLQLFRQVFEGSHLNLPFVEYQQVRSFAVEADADGPLNLDGELMGTAPFSVEVVPGALRLF